MRREVHWVRHLNRLFAVLAVLVARAAAGCRLAEQLVLVTSHQLVAFVLQLCQCKEVLSAKLRK